MENNIIKRLSVTDIYNIKLKILEDIKKLYNIDTTIENSLEQINGYVPYRIEYRYENHTNMREQKYVDRVCWRYLVNIFEFEKYMLCSDYDKINEKIDKFDIPEFNIKTANDWIDNIKQLIYDNVNKLVKSVFESITEKAYYTGSGWSNRKKKKRNNNGIDNHFILTTYDYSKVFGYHLGVTITDDLEKVCYILSGKKLPKVTCKDIMRQEKNNEFENEYFRLKICKNQNTHYWLGDKIRNKLNLYGSGNDTIGENIKIKILEEHGI